MALVMLIVFAVLNQPLVVGDIAPQKVERLPCNQGLGSTYMYKPYIPVCFSNPGGIDNRTTEQGTSSLFFQPTNMLLPGSFCLMIMVLFLLACWKLKARQAANGGNFIVAVQEEGPYHSLH